MNYPCKDCEKREPGCHSKCEAYRKLRKKNVKLNEQRAKENANNAVAVSAAVTRKRRNKSSIYNTHRR